MLRKLFRSRSIVGLPVMLLILVVAAACAAAEAPAPVIVEKEVIREVEVPVPYVVEKEVIKVVEQEAVVTPTPNPVGQPSVRWKGPVPTKYNEAPVMATLVEQGKLPSVDKRVSNEPLVLIGADGVGKYGGPQLRELRTRGEVNQALTHDGLLEKAFDGSAVEPNLAKAWKVENDYKSLTFYLRDGMKWSDGAPFSTDDLRFAWDATTANREYVGSLPTHNYGGYSEDPTMDVLDANTIRINFPEPAFEFFNTATTYWATQGMWPSNWGGWPKLYLPKHFLTQYHKEYCDCTVESLQKIADEKGVKDPVSLFYEMQSWGYNLGIPVIRPYNTKSGSGGSDEPWVQARNPYYWVVDPAGNQLPYIDERISILVSDKEILGLKLIAGDADFQRRMVDGSKLTLFSLNGEKEGYRVVFRPWGGMDGTIQFNQTYTEDPEIVKWIRNKEFRRALALAYDKEKVHVANFFGLGEASSVPASFSPFYLGDERSEELSRYDPAEANKILDSIGLDKKDDEGYRLRTDGKGRLQILLYDGHITGSQYLLPMAELFAEDAAEVGIKLNVKFAQFPEGDEALNKIPMDISFGSENPWMWPTLVPKQGGGDALRAVLVGAWYASEGKNPIGIDPSTQEHLHVWAEVLDLYDRGKKVTSKEDQIAIGKEIINIVAGDYYVIGAHTGSPMLGGISLANRDLRGVMIYPSIVSVMDRIDLYWWAKTPSGR